MPRPLKLTKERVADLLVLGDLRGEEANSLLEGLKGATPPPLTPTQFRQIISKALPQRSSDEHQKLTSQLLRLCRLRLTHRWTGADVVSAVFAGNEAAAEKLAPIQAQLVEIVSSPALLTFTKTMDLTYEHDNLFQSARIFTDIRPIFSEDASTIVGTVIAFTLKVAYYTLDGPHSVSVAMDSKDLTELTEQCSRADKKGRRAQAFVQAGLSVGTVIAGQDEDDNA